MRLDKFAVDSRRRRRIRVQSDTLHQLHDHVVQVGGDPVGRRQTSAPAECTPASFDVELLHVILVFSASSPPRLVFERGARDDQGLHTVAAPGGAETQVAAQRAAADAGAAWRVARPVRSRTDGRRPTHAYRHRGLSGARRIPVPLKTADLGIDTVWQ